MADRFRTVDGKRANLELLNAEIAATKAETHALVLDAQATINTAKKTVAATLGAAIREAEAVLAGIPEQTQDGTR